MIVESGGVPSWVAPRIDEIEMINGIPNDGARAEGLDEKPRWAGTVGGELSQRDHSRH